MRKIPKIPKELQSKWSLKKPLYLEKKDKRYSQQVKQLKENGFCDSETWGLDSVIAEFILPRLIRFRELNIGFPSVDGLTFDRWQSVIDEMIFAFDWSLNYSDDKYDCLSKSEMKAKWKRHDEGLEFFAKYFRDLWW